MGAGVADAGPGADATGAEYELLTRKGARDETLPVPTKPHSDSPILTAMTQGLIWDEVRLSWERLESQALALSNLEFYVLELSGLEATVYQEFSELERNSYAYPDNEDAREKFMEFHASIYAPSSEMASRCAKRLAPWFDSLPVEWQPALKPFVFSADFDPEVLRTLHEAEVFSQNFSRIQNNILYAYRDNSGDINTDQVSQERTARERAYLGFLAAEGDVAEEMADLFRELHKIRRLAAKRAGFDDYISFVWHTEALAERDYKHEDVMQLRVSIKKYICPLLVQIRNHRKSMLNVGKLRPWDLDVRYSTKSATLKAKTAEQALAAASAFLSTLPEPMNRVFNEHHFAKQYLLVDSNEPYRQSYSNYLPNENMSWMTSWYTGSYPTIFSMIHEIGHTLHRSMMPDNALFRQKFPTMEYAEFVPQYLEARAIESLNEFYEDYDENYMNLLFLETMLESSVRRTMLDEYQEIIYRSDTIDRDYLNNLYIKLLEEYPTGVDIADLDCQPTDKWMDWHIFTRPFYGIEYAIAWLGVAQALQMEQSPEIETIFSRCQDASTSQIFADLGIQLIPTDATLERLSCRLGDQIQRLTLHMVSGL